MTAPTAERLSLLAGLLILMLATVPRYLAGGHDNRLALIAIVIAVVAVVAVGNWRMLGAGERARLPLLGKRLALSLVAGLAAMGLWHALFTDWVSWQLLIAHGATLGLLLHALWLWWRPLGAQG
ncbi:hypothetical protein HOP62_02990 [Halomonas sp. MCCC 1A17488]|uniref:Transmembrane protein n=1 Tax=Billgrantia sulfidoxydans TaxID=2733484 RepID=A0ABX7W618_9GAMM|nr:MULTISPECIES: hypothetical protein [Halomonas]MCE8015039.1 hypothetical protein [Halomonas sp. MCCC 1A17488]MCG3238372.1 hypothetical protein [Halomonas sp. MCCC 1A17488]QPP47882.1 hypothetical protein I4484_11410 [Halomonas sp. SS10-MC5]QTP55185.1 hypothetical protein HNO51_11115 [Halomonas sulfidoxydans]